MRLELGGDRVHVRPPTVYDAQQTKDSLHFQIIEEEDLTALINGCYEEKTKKQTRWGLKIFCGTFY